ncbi:MAG: hypothetical protein OHK0017_02670 [Patescibacteria group bacterium]
MKNTIRKSPAVNLIIGAKRPVEKFKRLKRSKTARELYIALALIKKIPASILKEVDRATRPKSEVSRWELLQLTLVITLIIGYLYMLDK